MTEQYPSDAELNGLSGTTDNEQEVLFITTGEAPYYTSFYKTLQRLLKVARRGGDLRVFKDADLTFGVRAGRYYNGDSWVSYSQVTAQSLTNNATNYVFLTAAGTLTVNTTGFPAPSVTPHIPLATIVTSAGAYDGRDLSEGGDITDYRGGMFINVAGHSFAYATDSMVIVQRGATDAANGTNLLAAYTAAKALTPGGNALSATNRACVLIPPGKYMLPDPGSMQPWWTLDASYVDIVSMQPTNPAAVLIYGDPSQIWGTHIIYQNTADVRLSGLTLKDHGAMGHALYIGAIDNSASEYRYICGADNNADLGSGEGSIAGLWEFCDGGAFSWRCGGTGSTMSATMRYCTAGANSFGGDASGVDINGTFDHCTGGEESFGGCSTIGGNCSGTFYDCIAGDRSFAMNRTFSGEAYRCQAGADSFAGFDNGASYGVFSGYAEDCVATGRSFGSGHSDSRNSGRLVRCRCTGMLKPIRLEGATIEDCVLKVTANNEDCVVLEDGDSKILKSILLVNQGGTGIPINDDGSARNVVAAHCLMNNATNDADGLGTNVTNLIGTPCNVVDDDMDI